MPSVQEADDAFEHGEFAAAAQLYEAAIASGCPDCPREGEYRKFPKWREATLRVAQAQSLRRARLLDQALDALNPVFRMLPRYKEAWLEMGKLMLDVGRPDAALSAFENILKFDRTFPVLPYLVRAKANMERAHAWLKQSLTADLISDGRRAPSLPFLSDLESDALEAALARAAIQPPARSLPAADYYSMLGVSSEFSPDELKKAYKRMSRITHPDKNGGSNTRFQAVAAAYETLSDADLREAYDAGGDVKRDLMSDGSEGPAFWDKVRKEYFPEQFGFEPFGDPYEHKRDFQEKRRQEKPPEPNGQDIPVGSYQHSCQGCSMLGERRLRCTHCPNGRGQRLESSILVKDCSDAEWIGNHAGKLACEARPQQALPPHDADAQPDAEYERESATAPDQGDKGKPEL